jgi:hypothetical protein
MVDVVAEVEETDTPTQYASSELDYDFVLFGVEVLLNHVEYSSLF